MDASERELFDRTVAQAVGEHGGQALDAALDDLGWHDALDADPRTAVSLLFGHVGRANAVCGAIDHVVAAGLGVDGGSSAVVLPQLGGTEPPGRVVDGRLHVRGVATARVLLHPTVLVPTDGAVLEVERERLSPRPARGLDEALGLVVVDVDGLPGSAGAVEVAPTTPGAWSAAVATAQLAVGHELIGASRAMLGLAREHALERVQFGRPIAAFQAVRHRLADTLVAIESAEAVVDGAWEDRSPVTAAMAKSVAGRAARTTARHCQQVLAGIGFTTEHDLHRYVRRVLVLDELLGSSRSLTASLGRDLLAARRLAPVLPL